MFCGSFDNKNTTYLICPLIGWESMAVEMNRAVISNGHIIRRQMTVGKQFASWFYHNYVVYYRRLSWQSSDCLWQGLSLHIFAMFHHTKKAITWSGAEIRLTTPKWCPQWYLAASYRASLPTYIFIMFIKYVNGAVIGSLARIIRICLPGE